MEQPKSSVRIALTHLFATGAQHVASVASITMKDPEENSLDVQRVRVYNFWHFKEARTVQALRCANGVRYSPETETSPAKRAAIGSVVHHEILEHSMLKTMTNVMVSTSLDRRAQDIAKAMNEGAVVTPEQLQFKPITTNPPVAGKPLSIACDRVKTILER